MSTFSVDCALTGVHIGVFSYQPLAGGTTGYATHWRDLITVHPLFSLPAAKLLAFSRSEWNRLGRLSADSEASAEEEQILQVAFVAMLHSLDCVKQEVPALPSIAVVQENMSKLFALAYWKHYLESKRFRFPTLRISKENPGLEHVSDFLAICFDVKADYEQNISDVVEAAKLRATERAMKLLRNSWIVPVGKKQLFKWVAAHMPERYEADKEGWMGTLFCGSERTILDFDKEDIQLLDEIISSECPNGNAIMHAVRQRLDEIAKIYTDNKEAFTIDFDEIDIDESLETAMQKSSGYQQAKAAATLEAPLLMQAPKQADFPDKVSFIRANALWYLQSRKAAAGEQL